MAAKNAKNDWRAWDVLPKIARDLLPAVRQLLPIPDELPGLFPIASNLCAVEEETRRLLALQGADAADVFDFARAVDGVDRAHPARTSPKLTGKFEASAGSQGRVTPPVYGYYSEYPVWSALWFRHGYPDTEPEAGTIYRALQAHYLAAYILLRYQDDVLERPSRPYEAGRLLRTIHQPAHASLCLAIGSRNVERPYALHVRLLNLRDSLREDGKKAEAHGLAALAQLVRLAHEFNGEEEFAERARSSTRGSRRRRPRYRFDVLHPDHSQYWAFVPPDGQAVLGARGVAVDVDLPGGDHAGFLDEQGADPWEYGHYGHGFVDANVIDEGLGDLGETDPGSLPPLQTLLVTARARGRHVAMAAQRLSVAQQRVRPAEIADFVALLCEAYATAQAQVTNTEKDKEWRAARLRTLRLVAACFVTAGRPDDFLSSPIPVIRGVKELPRHYTLALNREHKMWIRPYRTPNRAPLAESVGAAAETWPRVVFPDVWGASHTDDVDGLATLAQHRPKTLKRHWDSVISEFGPRRIRPKWLHLHAIQRILPSWCRSLEEGDHLPWRLLFGDDDALASTHHFYTAYDREALASKYESVMGRLAAEVGLEEQSGAGEANRLLAWTPMAWEAPRSLVGDDRVLRIESVRTLVQKAGEAITASANDNPYEVHNAHATYFGLLLALITGYRAVRTPFVDVSAVDRDTGVMCLQEKDRYDGVHARFVILPPALREQLDIYLRGLRKLWIRLPSEQRASLTVHATKRRDRSAFGTPRFELDLTSTLFLFERSSAGSYAPVEFTGHRLKQRLDALVPGHWPVANAGRHLVRTYLTSRGAEPTIINAMMGHASYGEEPWAPSSSLDPLIWREHLLPYLEDLLQVIGFEVVGHG